MIGSARLLVESFDSFWDVLVGSTRFVPPFGGSEIFYYIKPPRRPD